MSKQISLAFSRENSEIADKIISDLSSTDYTFHSLIAEDNPPKFINQLETAEGRILLLISENMLHSIPALVDSLKWYQTLADKITVIVIDGYVEEEGVRKSVPTNFDKVSSVIKYMKYWQDMYLDLRKEKRESDSIDAVLNQKIADVRAISSEIGEFLRLVRSSDYHKFEDFKEDDYRGFFRLFNDSEGHSEYRKSSASTSSGTSETQVAEEVQEAVETVTTEVEAVSEMPESPLVKSEEIQVQAPVVEVPDIIGSVQEELQEETLEEPIATEEEDFSEIDISAIPGMNLLSNTEEDTPEPIEEQEQTLDDLIAEVVSEEEAENGYELEELNSGIFGEEEEPLEEESEEIEEVTVVGELEPETEVIAPASKTDIIKDILAQSRAELEEGEVSDALNTLKQGTESFPEEVNLRYYYAFILANHAGNTQAALEELTKVFLKNPTHTDAHYLSGEIAELNEDFLAAKKHYEKVLEADVDYPNAHYRIGSVLAKRFVDQESRAIQHFKKALKQDSDNVDALYQTARLYEMKLRDGERAVKYYKKTLKVEPENTEALMGLARVARSLEDPAAAKEYYRQAVQLEPNLATEANQKLFAPDLISKPYISAKDTRVKELEAELANLQSKLAEMESAAARQTADYEKITADLQKISGSGLHANGTTNHSGETGVSSETLSAVEEVPDIPKSDKTVFITGATSGIGRATADLFAKNGYRLILTGRRVERLEELKKQFETDFNSEVKILNYDVRDVDSVREAVQNLEGLWQNVDILINNAGLAKGFSPIQEGNLQHWEQMIDTNIKGLLYMTRAISPGMVERKSGHIINVCSTAGHEVYPKGNVYCATKHAVDALTKSMRIDLHTHNIRVSQISPGHVEETEFARVRFDGDTERAKIYEDFNPLTSRDVAEAIYFMATRPAHVNIQDVLLMGTQQANSNFIDRSGREA